MKRAICFILVVSMLTGCGPRPVEESTEVVEQEVLLSDAVEAIPWVDPDVSVRVYQDNAGEWRWKAVAKNGRTVATSGEGYKERRDCLNGFGLFKNAISSEAFEVRIEGVD